MKTYVEVPRWDENYSMIFEEARKLVNGGLSLYVLNKVAFLRLGRTFPLWSEDAARALLEVNRVKGRESDFYLVEDGKVILEERLGRSGYIEQVLGDDGFAEIIVYALFNRARRMAIRVYNG